MELVFSVESAFYLAAAVAVAATLMVIVQRTAVHALLYLIVSLLAIAVVFYLLGAQFAAALEVIVYAGAIMVLFVFVMMMLNLGKAAADQERAWLRPAMWIGPSILAALLLAELIYMLAGGRGGSGAIAVAGTGAGSAPAAASATGAAASTLAATSSKAVGIVLLGPYLLGVELASMLLLAGLVGACHLGWRGREDG